MEAVLIKEFFINWQLDSRMKILLLKWKLDWWNWHYQRSYVSALMSELFFPDGHCRGLLGVSRERCVFHVDSSESCHTHWAPVLHLLSLFLCAGLDKFLYTRSQTSNDIWRRQIVCAYALTWNITRIGPRTITVRAVHRKPGWTCIETSPLISLLRHTELFSSFK